MARNWDNEHFLNIDECAADIRKLYNAAASQIVKASAGVSLPVGVLFTFADFPEINKKVNKILAKLAAKAVEVITRAEATSWLISSEKNDALVKAILPGVDLEQKALERIMDRNIAGLETFQVRKSKGLNLSDRIWKTIPTARRDIETTIDVGLASGDSAADIARAARKNLMEPDKMFRRVKNDKGVLQLSKAAQDYKPGQGVYRSPVKNSQRLARTEVNMAYREADFDRWQNLDFVVGYEVQRSNHVYYCVQCESLKGRYPKTFKFRGWHPQCRCRCITILATKEEVDKMMEKILNDEDLSTFRSVNEVQKVPKGYATFIKENKPKLLRAKSTPYWISDNYKDGDLKKGLSL